MSTSTRWTIADLDGLPDPLDDTRYEIIDGELYVSKQPSLEHQYTCTVVTSALRVWSEATGRGMAFFAPGVIFAEDDNVAPDVVWLSRERLRAARGADGKLHLAPELMVEVLSLGAANERRDREAKRKLYARRGVDEYWIVDVQGRRVEVYRQVSGSLEPSGTFLATDRLESPLLPGFGVPVEDLFLSDTL